MTKQTTALKNVRTQYSQSYKGDALALAERMAFPKRQHNSAFFSLNTITGETNIVYNKARLHANNHWRMKMPS